MPETKGLEKAPGGGGGGGGGQQISQPSLIRILIQWLECNCILCYRRTQKSLSVSGLSEFTETNLRPLLL